MTLAVVVLLVLLLLALGLVALLWRQLRQQRAEAASQFAAHSIELRDRIATDERERIYANLHDDLGARLLGMVHAAESPAQADQARALLQDLRDVVTRSRGTPGTLDDVLTDIRAEATQRLAAVDMTLTWDMPIDMPAMRLDQGRALHLHRIVREATSNAIRHAVARHLRIRCAVACGQLRLELTDDGQGAGKVPTTSHGGIGNMRKRAQALAGDIAWQAGTLGGTKVLLTMPLETDP
ncbi:MAG TPA: ATP-binding protein [Rhodanobacteraceae bacterium]|nr:ATP-binding protein [Rhodanobacteraceae bacterium]